jgi:hypothetical protein
MKEYSIFHPLLFSFFSRSLYRDVARNWKGLGFLYLLLLLALAWIPATLTLHRSVGAVVNAFGPMVLEQVPPITITDGEVSTPVPQPHVIQFPGTGKPLIIIDTTGQITSLDSQEASVLVTKRQVAVRQNERETRIYDLSAVKSFTLDRQKLEAWGRVLRKWMAIALYPFLLVGSFVYRIAQVLIYGAIGRIFARIEKADLEYSDLVRLASVSITPAVLLDTLRGVLAVPTSFLWWFVCFAVAVATLFLAVRFSASPPPGQAPLSQIPGTF